MKRLRVLHLAKFYPPVRGGMERVLQLVCESTQKEVENVVLAAHTKHRTVHERQGTVRITRAGCIAKVGSVAICPTFPIWQSRLRADLAVLHEPNAIALVSDVLVRSACPLVVWYHSDLVRHSLIYGSAYWPLLRRALRRAASIIVSSPNLAAHAEGLHEVRHKCVVVPYGVDVSALTRRASMPGWLRTFRSEQPGPVALMVGRVVPYKGIDVFVRALVGTSVRAVIVGNGPDLERCRALAERLGIRSRVFFAGNVPDDELIAAYQACDFFVLPSITRQEAFGVVQLEAMACGKPVVSTDLPTGVPWVNRHRETGVIVTPGSVAALRAALDELAGDAELRTRLGDAARQRVLTEFTIDKMRDRTIAVYRRAMDVARARVGLEVDASPAARSIWSRPA